AEEPAGEIERAPQIRANLLKADRDVLVAFLLVLVLLFVFFFLLLTVGVARAGPSRHAVVAIVIADRDSQAGPLPDPREPGAERRRFGGAVAENAALAGRRAQLVRLFQMAFLGLLVCLG